MKGSNIAMGKNAQSFGPQDGNRFNVAVQRPTVNIKEAENVGEAAQAVVPGTAAQPLRFSKHGTFGPKKVTHPGFE